MRKRVFLFVLLSSVLCFNIPLSVFASGSENAKSVWLENNIDEDYTDEGVTLPDRDQLDYEDQVALGEWEEDVDSTREERNYSLIRVVRIIIGLLIMVYFSLFYVIYWLDRTNTVIDLSLLGLLTLGRFSVSEDDTVSTYRGVKNKGDVKLISHKDSILISVLGVLLGASITTGLLINFVVNIRDWVVGLF